MKALGFVTRALVIELIAVGGIAWFSTSDLPLWKKLGTTADPSVVQIAKTHTAEQQRKAYVQSRLERLSAQLRTSANQLVDEALATWFGK